MVRLVMFSTERVNVYALSSAAHALCIEIAGSSTGLSVDSRLYRLRFQSFPFPRVPLLHL